MHVTELIGALKKENRRLHPPCWPLNVAKSEHGVTAHPDCPVTGPERHSAPHEQLFLLVGVSDVDQAKSRCRGDEFSEQVPI
jgi:hypothetical protein